MPQDLTISAATRGRVEPADALGPLRAMQAEGVSATLVDHQGQPSATIGALADASALGTLGSGLLVVGDALVREAGGRWCDHVLVSAAEQHIVGMPVGDVAGHLLVVVAPRQLALGRVLWAARLCCAERRDTDSSTCREGNSPGD